MSPLLSNLAVPTRNNAFLKGHSPAIQTLNSMVEDVACTDIPVLLIGESGTGKEIYARMIHQLSRHAPVPLRKVSCRAVEQAEFITLKSSLRDGDGGPQTLFLDDIDELDLESQKLLLSLLAEGESDNGYGRRLRIIASTSKNLEKEVESGRFRKELYFRINGVSLQLPALRDRREDIEAFMEHFLAKHAAELGRETLVLGDREREFLATHEWPGNVRELENLARRIVLLGNSRRAIEELGETRRRVPRDKEEPQNPSLKMAARTASRRAERDLIAKALEQTHWNRKRAAQQLQISYKSLLYKIKQTGLEEK